jgi:hypothetical protein
METYNFGTFTQQHKYTKYDLLPMTMATPRLANASELFNWSPKNGTQISGIPSLTASSTLFNPQCEMKTATLA